MVSGFLLKIFYSINLVINIKIKNNNRINLLLSQEKFMIKTNKYLFKVISSILCIWLLRSTHTLAFIHSTSTTEENLEIIESLINPNAPITIFAHGLGGNNKQGYHYYIRESFTNAFIENSLVTFNFEDAKNPKSSCLGQENDIATLHSIVQKYKSAILMGVSRGGATVANYLSMHPNPHIKAAILESPFDTVASIVAHKCLFSWLHPFTFFMFSKYKPFGIQPIKIAKKIPQDIPILIICSKEDDLIPASSSINLYKKLYNTGHRKAHILILNKGAHASILWGEEGHIYRNVVHAFYKAYKFPYNSLFAQAGEERFNTCQPTTTYLS
jgi:pimeloyl-ACP methyl ester carboxylesterase